VAVVGLADVRDSGEPSRESFANGRLPDVALAKSLGPARCLEDSIVDEVIHDRVEVVPVETGRDFA
jgi:hypothetical protein